jgi:hypothetical protein
VREILLDVVSWQWRGRALVIWTALAFDLLKSFAGLACAAAALAAILRAKPSWWDRRVPLALKSPVLAAAAVLLAGLKLAQYLSLQGTTDAAAYLSCVWNAFHGTFLPSVVYGYAEQLSLRFNPILVLFAPIAKLTGSPLMVVLAQAMIVGSSVVAMWELGKAVGLDEAPRWLLCLLLAANPYFNDCLATWFFPDTLPLPIFLAAIASLERRRYGLFAFFCLLLLGTKEEAGVALVAFAGALCCLRSRRREGLALMGAAAASFLLIAWGRSFFSGGESDSEWMMFGLGATAGESLRFIAAHPLAALARWGWPPGRFLAVLRLLASVGGLPLLFPAGLLGVVLSDAPHQLVPQLELGYHRLDNHYSAYLLPILFWASARAVGAYWSRARWRSPLAACMLLSAAAGLWNSTDYVGFFRVSGERLRTGWRYVFEIGPDEAVWTAQAFSPALSFRSRLRVLDTLHQFPEVSAGFVPDAILGLKSHLGERPVGAFADYLASHRFVIAREERDLILWRRSP